jgi:alkanesulfonate monooxygenase SsuD/methylene tetrahydromethanopterin reductase-like flavin-dependent oxidoreductase (luciferase family)
VSKIGICFIQAASEIAPDFIPRLATKTEEIGLHSFWANDRLTGSYFEPVTVITAATSVTKKINLGTSIVLPVLRHPIVLAKTLDCIDFLSGGRLILGIGFGGSQKEFDAVEIPFERRGARAVEQIDLMKQLWREDHVSYEGEFFKTTDLSIGPHPIQRPSPPIWMGGWSRRGAEASRQDCGWLHLRDWIFEPLSFDMDKNRCVCNCARERPRLNRKSWNHLPGT